MRVLVETDVLIDLALDRHHADAAAALIGLLEAPHAQGYLAWDSASNFYYLVAPTRGGHLPLGDFEDAMQVAAALACGADVIATRNIRDYAKAPVEAMMPGALVRRLSK